MLTRMQSCYIGETPVEDNTEGTRKGRRNDYTQPRKGRYSLVCTNNTMKVQNVAEMTTSRRKLRGNRSNGMIKLAMDIQGTMFQGNASTSAAAGLATELGIYNALGFDGLRSITGSQGTYAGNNALQQDIGSLNMLESLQSISAKAANNGGNPTMVMLSMNAKQALDIEQQSAQRYNNDKVDIIPGVRASQVAWANGLLTLMPVPGTSIGSYTRASDGATVEDIYVIDESVLTLRWLYSESFTVLQIPSGVDGQLSNRFLIFGMFGMELAAPLFCGKVRRVAS